jgi:DNA-binding response OmpR family regulator
MSIPVNISVLLVEDNVTLREELSDFLRAEGFMVKVAGDGQEMNLAIERDMPDILILDLNLPLEDGIDITKRIRSSLPELGIIILSARVRSSDRKDGYESGADIYLTKPTNPVELVSVIQNLHRRLKPVKTQTTWQLDTIKNIITSPSGIEIKTTGSETMLLKELILHGRFATHENLISYVGDPDKDEETNKLRIEVLISRLRKKLSPHIDPSLFINVLRGRGYQLKVQIELKNMSPMKLNT